MYEKILEAVNFIRERYDATPEIGIISGTGLGGLVNLIEVEFEISYRQIPYFPVASVTSHAGKLVFGNLEGKKVVLMDGRVHYYEGFPMQQVVFPVRVMKLLGISNLLISNAAGGLNPTYTLSKIVVITDHIDLMKGNPLTGPNLDEMGPRFPDMSEPYSRELIEKSRLIASESGLNLGEGVYSAVSGPNLETPAEYKMLRILGADLVGMSTVPEAIAAAHAGLPVFAVSVVTDLCFGEIKKVELEDVLAAAAAAEPDLLRLFSEMVKKI